jgi:large subunit ribosomal protein L7/L12
MYDVKLTSFDAAKKITIIKEIRAWLNLGLKEAKELVEKAPTDLKKSVKKEEAEEWKKKLTENGAVIDLI